jgi:AcrR family transcriptional regulator
MLQSFTSSADLLGEKSNRAEGILSAANELFLARGYDATSIDDIRQAMGFRSKASIYTHFKSKEDVVEALIQRTAVEMNEFVFQRVQKLQLNFPNAAPINQFTAIARAYIEWGLRHPQQYSFRFLRTQQKRILLGYYDCEKDILAPLYSQFEQLIGYLRNFHPVRDIPDYALLTIMLGIVGRSVIDREHFGELEITEKVEKILDICLSVLLESSADIKKIMAQ